MLALYQLAQQVGRGEFLAASGAGHEQRTFGAEYLQAILIQPQSRPTPGRTDLNSALPAALQVPQLTVERALSHYEQYVANRVVVAGGIQ